MKIISSITLPSAPPLDGDADPAPDDLLDEPIGMGARREQGLGLRTKAGLAGTAEIEIRRAEGGRKTGALMEKRLQSRPQVVHPDRSGWR